jgi:hypothetical protein
MTATEELDQIQLLAQHVYPAGAPTNLWLCDAYVPNASGEEYAEQRYLLEFGEEQVRFDGMFEKQAWERFNQVGEERSAQLKAARELITALESLAFDARQVLTLGAPEYARAFQDLQKRIERAEEIAEKARQEVIR